MSFPKFEAISGIELFKTNAKFLDSPNKAILFSRLQGFYMAEKGSFSTNIWAVDEKPMDDLYCKATYYLDKEKRNKFGTVDFGVVDKLGSSGTIRNLALTDVRCNVLAKALEFRKYMLSGDNIIVVEIVFYKYVISFNGVKFITPIHTVESYLDEACYRDESLNLNENILL